MTFVYMSEIFQKAHPWHIYEGKGIVLFYLPGETNDPHVVQQKAKVFDWGLCENYRIFQLDPLWFKVHIFLFPDAQSHATAMESDEPIEGGCAQIHSVTITDIMDFVTLSCLAIHELAHVVTMNQFAYSITGFLMEGIAVYAQNAAPETAWENLDKGWDAPAITMDEPLSELMETADFDYSHAGAFVGYLLRRDEGKVEKLIALCRIVAELHWLPDAVRVDRAVNAVYGVSLEALEGEWRK